jgi:hypothetical protein
VSGNYLNKYINTEFRPGQDYKFGNEWSARIGATDQYLIGSLFIYPTISIFYRHSVEDEINDEPIPNTGGDFIFVESGVQLGVTKNARWFVSGQIPIYAHVVGTQLSTSWRLHTGFHYFFQSKSIFL